MRPILLAAILLVAAPLAGCVQTEDAPQDDGNDAGDGSDGTTEAMGWKANEYGNVTATMVTNFGVVELRLFGDMTPQTVLNFGTLANDGYYDGTRFHRVIEGFMIQGGDPKSADESLKNEWGTGGPGYAIADEFPCADGFISNQHPGSYRNPATQCDQHDGFALEHSKKGILSMANSGPRSGGSQFFITVAATPHLNGYHTVFGEVVSGMDVVESISHVETECTANGQQPGCGRDRPVDDVIVESITIDGTVPDEELQKY